jgi:hypothetical protein
MTMPADKTDDHVIDVVLAVLGRMEHMNPRFYADRDTAVRMLERVTDSKVEGGGLRWKGDDMETTIAVLYEARRLLDPAAALPSRPGETDEEVVAAGEARFRAMGPEARKALRAVDQSLEALRMMEATKLPVAKGGTA